MARIKCMNNKRKQNKTDLTLKSCRIDSQAPWWSLLLWFFAFRLFFSLFLRVPAPNMMFSLYNRRGKISSLCFLVKSGMTPESFTAWTHGLVNPWLIMSSHGIKKIRPRIQAVTLLLLVFCMAWIWLAQYISTLGSSSSFSPFFSSTISPSICFLRAHYIIKTIKQ